MLEYELKEAQNAVRTTCFGLLTTLECFITSLEHRNTDFDYAYSGRARNRDSKQYNAHLILVRIMTGSNQYDQ